MVQITARDTDRVAERRREILEAASRCFREKGFHATGMRDIAARLSVTPGSLYYYFKNKEELLAFCHEQTLERLTASARAVAALDLGCAERLARLVVEHVVALNEGMPGSLAHLEAPALESGRVNPLLRQRDAYEKALRALIEEGVREGVFRDVDGKTAAMAILGAVNWTVRWFRPEGGRSARDIGRDFARQLVGGLMIDPDDLETFDD